jgi:hypothetical protein
MNALVLRIGAVAVVLMTCSCAPKRVLPPSPKASPSTEAQASPVRPESQQTFEFMRKDCASAIEADDSGVYLLSKGPPDGAFEMMHVGAHPGALRHSPLPLVADARILATRALAGKLSILAISSKLELLTVTPNGYAERTELWPSYGVAAGTIGPNGVVAFTTGDGAARQLHVHRPVSDHSETAFAFSSSSGRVVISGDGLFLDENADGAELSPGISFASFHGLRAWRLAVGPIRALSEAGASGVWVTARYVQNLFIGSALFHSDDAKSVALLRVDAGEVRDLWMIAGTHVQLLDERPASDGTYYGFLGVPETLDVRGQKSRFSAGRGHYLFRLDVHGNGHLEPLAIEFGAGSLMAVSSKKIFILSPDAQQSRPAKGTLRCTLASFDRSQSAH